MRTVRFGIMSVCAATLMLSAACNTVDDDRIPALPVNINLSTADLWNTYGVFGYGNYRLFVRELRLPKNFAYTERTATGYGGVLLLSGVNPYTLEAAVPLAYDLSCPVEAKPEIRVKMEVVGEVPVAVCPECGSMYDVVERGGAPIEGMALSRKLGMSMYECRQSPYGGYLIVN